MNKGRVKEFLMKNPEYYELVKRIYEYEETHEAKFPDDTETGYDWEAGDIPISHWQISKLMGLGVVKIGFKTRSTKCYYLSDHDLIGEILKEIEEGEYDTKEEYVIDPLSDVEVTDDDINRFKSDIERYGPEVIERYAELICPKLIGITHVKVAVLLQMLSLKDINGTRNRIHILLVGKPGTGKSTLMNWLKRYFKVIKASHRTSDVGLTGNMVTFEEGILAKGNGWIVATDEIDKLDKSDTDGLLECMEEGTVTLSGKKYVVYDAETRVIAGANKLPESNALVDRFDFIFYLHHPKKDLAKEIISRIIDMWNLRTSTEIASIIKKYVKWCNEFEPKISDTERERAKEIMNKYIDREASEEIRIRKYERYMRVALAIARALHTDFKAEYIDLAHKYLNYCC
mgnify:CR=1 FL=1